MTTYADSQNYTVAAFIEDVKAMLEALGPTDAALEQAGRLLRHLAARDDLHPAARHAELSDRHQSVVLHAEPGDSGPTLWLAKVPAEGAAEVHNHYSWGVACVYKGANLYVKWARRDDGGRVGYAEVAEVERRLLHRGEYVWWLDPPDDLHSERGQDGAPAWELVLTGRDILGLERLIFDPETGRVRAGPGTTP